MINFVRVKFSIENNHHIKHGPFNANLHAELNKVQVQFDVNQIPIFD